MMLVGVGCYCSRLPLQLGIAETISGDGGSEVKWWSHCWCIVGLALSERHPIALVSARDLKSVVYFAESRLLLY